MNLRHKILKSGICAAAILLAGGVVATTESHTFFICGWNSGGPALFDGSFKEVWRKSSADECTDGWVLPDGGIVYSFSRRKEKLAGVVRLDQYKKERWVYTAPEGNDNHSCQPLPDGGFLLGECGPDALWMVEIDAKGKEKKRVKVADAPKDRHHAFRAVRKTPQGTYLATLMNAAGTLSGGHAYEWDSTGALLHTFPSGSFHAVRLPDGHTLVSNGHGENGVLMVEYGPGDAVVWQLTAEDLEKAGLGIKMVCGFQRLPNGNTVITNVRHGTAVNGLESGEQPKVFELSSDKKVVWKVPAETSTGSMGSVQILNVPGNPLKFEVFR